MRPGLGRGALFCERLTGKNEGPQRVAAGPSVPVGKICW
jgi:hypothetical protein